MSRTSQEVTQAEIEVYEAWIKDNNVANTDENAMTIATYVLDEWGVEFTRENLDAALVQLRPSLTFYTALQAEYHKLAARMTSQQINLVFSMIKSRGLKDSSDDERLTNFNTIVSYYSDSNLPISADTFDTVVGRITTSGRRPLLWRPRLQPSEAQQQEEAAAKQQPARQVEDDVVIPKGLDPRLHDHYRAMHRAPRPEDVVSSKPVNADSRFKQLAEDAVASIPSHLDRAEAEKFLTKAGAWSWELVYRSIINFAERRKHQRSSVGR